MKEQIFAIVSALGVLGIPTIFSLTVWCVKACKGFATQLNILMESQKAQMRSQLLKDFKKYAQAGYVELEDLQEWENQYKQYHILPGANEILDAKREELIKLPNIRQN